jgi:hypothetical protein
MLKLQKRKIMKKLLILPLFSTILMANSKDVTIRISSDMSTVKTKSAGKSIEIKRVQDINNRLTDDYTKTSRACPPFCIQPTKISDKIENIEELELLDFIRNRVSQNRGVIIDSRLKSWFELETIPTAINIPFTTVTNGSKEKIGKIFKLLGMKIKSDGSWDFSNVKELAFFDNGIWCSQAKHFIDAILKYNYPRKKLFYYRSGLQGWKLLGLTTAVHKEIKK